MQPCHVSLPLFQNRKRKFSEAVDQNFQFGMEEAPPRKSARVKRQEEEKERETEREDNGKSHKINVKRQFYLRPTT